MSYCTVINCMDGRVQRPALDWRDRTIRCRRVDSITESGVNGLWIDEWALRERARPSQE